MTVMDERCPTCNAILQERRDVVYCPNGCSRLTVQVPARDNHDSMLQDELGSGCYVRRRAYVD